MKILGNEERVNTIELTHGSIDIRFTCFGNPFPYAPRRDLVEANQVTIVFDDMREIDELISMLEKFRNGCHEYIGEWRRIQ